MTQAAARKVALDHLSTPEQLDLPIQVIRPADWLILLPVLGLLAAVAAWGWFGSIPTKVSGKCILINPNGVVDVTAAAGGRLAELAVQVGDTVQRGQRIASISLPELSDQIDKAREKLLELQALRTRVDSLAQRSKRLNADLIAQQRQLLQAQLRSSDERLRLLRERQDAQARLQAQGVITQLAWIAARQELNTAQAEHDSLTGQLSQLDLRRLDADKQSDGEVGAIDGQIVEQRRRLDTLLRSRQNTTVIDSPFSGRVVEIKAGTGTMLAQGTPVLSIEADNPGGQPLEAAIFVPAGDGKRVAPQMIAQVTPATVRREEVGYLLAPVRYVAEYPSSQQRMQLLLQNDTLVRELTGSSPPIEIRAALQPQANASGYKWSTPQGAPVKIRGGTLCQAEIVVATQRPASLVMPILKKSLGVD